MVLSSQLKLQASDMTSEFIPLPYSDNELRQYSRIITREVSTITLSGHRITMHDIHPTRSVAHWSIAEHTHSFYEGHFVLEGNGYVTVNHELPIRQGCALLHEPHIPHLWGTTDGECLCLVLWFSIEPHIALQEPSAWPIWPETREDIRCLFQEAEGTLPGWKDRLAPRLSVIMSRLLTLGDYRTPVEHQKLNEESLVESVEQFISDNLSRSLTLADVAAHVGMGERNLTRRFRQLTGETIIERQYTQRMDHAASLLVDTNETISGIALRIGMPDPSYFCRRFRKHFRISPQVYRQIHRQ